MKKLALLLCLIMLCALCSCIATAAPSETLSGEPSAEPSPPSAEPSDALDFDYDAYTSNTEFYPQWAQPNTVITYDADSQPTFAEGGLLAEDELADREDIALVGLVSTEEDMRIRPDTKVDYDTHGFIQNIYFAVPDSPGEYRLTPPEAMGDGIDADAAWKWLLAELEESEDTAKLVQTKTVGGYCVILADLLKPATEDVYLAEIFLLEPSEDAFTIAARESVDPPVSAGFTADLLYADGITVVFGDLSDSFYEFWHDERVYTTYTEARIMFTDGTEHTVAVSNDTPYMAIVDGTREVSDVEFVTDARSILWSEFYDHAVGDDNPYDELSAVDALAEIYDNGDVEIADLELRGEILYFAAADGVYALNLGTMQTELIMDEPGVRVIQLIDETRLYWCDSEFENWLYDRSTGENTGPLTDFEARELYVESDEYWGVS